MNPLRLVIVGVGFLLAAAACDDTTSDPQIGSSTNPARNAVNQCNSAVTSSKSNCGASELESYDSCVQNRCDSEYKKCLGPTYQSGSFSGVCGTFFTCANACSCIDDACRAKCTLGPDCQSCMATFTTCKQGCVVPACVAGSSGSSGSSSGSSGSSGSSSDCAMTLTYCCAAIGNENIQHQCLERRDAVSGDDVACKDAYNSYKSYCPF